ncbi:MAG: SMP-30/gluconolactonase/LRE family protein, partial [Chloroflexi bacterium]|nr:SMP-30/gluconolactonase/LRE family protein [Chloroflexota bacterium]
AAAAGAAPNPPPDPVGAPAATVDLATDAGARLVEGEWRYSDAKIVEVQHRLPDANGQPTGAPVTTNAIEPRAGWAAFDDSKWPVIAPSSLVKRRSTGRLCFNWYRIDVTIPAKVGAFDPSGSSVVFETVLDDYAEVWVDGEIARGLGQRGGSVVGGWNAPNRLVIARGVRPGQQIQLAVFGANGPLSDPPANFIWMRSAKLDFYAGPAEPYAIPVAEVNVEVVRKDPALDAIVPANPKIFKLAEGFQFTEGPLWLPGRGVLLFSDPNANRIYQYDPKDGGTLSVFREKAGYDGADIAEYFQPGSNGLTLDPQGHLTIDEHGRHRIVQLNGSGESVVLVDSYQGKRLNSPNDLVYRSDGTLFFTDPPFGLPKFFDDPKRELPYSGVFALSGGKLRLLTKELAGPNGLAFSPDEKFLYVTNWDVTKKVVMRYAVAADGSLSDGRVFFDMTKAPEDPGLALDGIKVDKAGNLYVSGPGGLWVIDPAGKHLGTLKGPRLAANFAWGDDGKTLYLTARSGLYRLPLLVEGIRP